MSMEFEKKIYTTPEQAKDQDHHEELIQMLNHTESHAHSDPINALKRLKETLAKMF